MLILLLFCLEKWLSICWCYSSSLIHCRLKQISQSEDITIVTGNFNPYAGLAPWQ